MNENIDLTKILEGCPVGTEFYSPLLGVVNFRKITDGIDFPIRIVTTIGTISDFTAKGYFYLDFDDVECQLFPSKTQRDWSKFERFWDKPKVERFNPKTFQPFDKILVRDNTIENWQIGFFSHIEYDLSEYIEEEVSNLEFLIATAGGCDVSFCIPYNDDTKHLVGTREDCPEYYKWWEK